jgi:hypothetical protein
MIVTRKPKRWTIEQDGIRVRLFQNSAHWWADVRLDGARNRLSLRTSDKGTAETNARSLATALATQKLLGVTSSTLTFGQLFAAYFEHKGRTLEGQWKKQAEAHRKSFLAAWGETMPVVSISQTSVDAYCRGRRAAWAAKNAERQTRTPEESRTVAVLRDGAVDCDFRWLSSVMNWAHGHKLPNGKRLLDVNPLHDCTWPREKHVRRPVASEDRYTRTLEHVAAVDAKGRLRLALALARHTGHRIDAILNLRVSDVLRTPEAIQSALAAAGTDEGDALHMPHGALRWRAENDKMGMLHIAPLSPVMREEIDAYMGALPRIGDVPLFPADKSTTAPVKRFTATKWLLKAEELAKLPKLAGGLWHPYRRLWATQRKHLPDADVAMAGGWKGTKAMKLSYQQSTADGVLAAILNAG